MIFDQKTVLLICLALPLSSGLLVLAPKIRRFSGWPAFSTATALFILLATHPPTGDGIALSFSWLPALDLRAGFALDGLSYMYALMITFIGALILLYSLTYLPHEIKERNIQRSEASYYSLLLFFMASMLGLVLSVNLLIAYVFWELTGVVSFLLISYSGTDRAIKAAAKALWITMLGGLIMFVGFVLLYLVTGTWELHELIAVKNEILSDHLYPYILTAIFIGAAAKSVQIPFHIWLPPAMEAPTPVSAYLHSATMVAAGAFLIGRIYPVLAGSDLWFWLVGTAGFATMITGAILALFQTKIKGILAYSTISQYGYMFALYGMGTALGATTATFIVFNHALIKASLFLIAGIVTYATGKKDLEDIPQLRREMPLVAFFTGLSALSLAGLPLLNGFWMKEFLYKSVLEFQEPAALALAVTASVLTFVYSVNLFARLFLKHAPAAPIEINRPTKAMIVPVGILSLLCLLLGVAPWLSAPLITPAAGAVLDQPALLNFKLHWPPDAALWLTLVTFTLGGALLAFRQSWLHPLASIKTAYPGFGFNFLYEQFFVWLDSASRLFCGLQSGYLRIYTAILFLSTAALFFSTAPSIDLSQGATVPLGWPLTAIFILLVLSALATTLPANHMVMVLSLSAAGYLGAAAIALMRAPDVALTQVLVETISLILFLLVLAKIPHRAKQASESLWRSRGSRLVDALIAATTGLLVFIIYLYVSAPPVFEPAAKFYVSQGYRLTGLQDTVVAILVDFRALDTVGEIAVILIAAVGVSTMLFMRGARDELNNDKSNS